MDNAIFESIEVFPWNSNFETGIPLIDEQHQQLVHLLNVLAAHLAQKSEPVVLEEVFAALADYAHYHFSTEETIWNEYFAGDEWLTTHEHTHEKFLIRVQALKQQEQTKSLDEMVDETIKFLTHWLAFHILDNDMRMAKAIHAMKSGLQLEQAKEQSTIEMSGVMKMFTTSILAMYDKLTSRTLELVRERTERIKMENELLELSERLREKEKREIYVSMLHASQHILNNMLNQLLLFKMEAERSTDFNKKLLHQFDDVFNEANSLVMRLSNVSHLTTEGIKNSISKK